MKGLAAGLALAVMMACIGKWSYDAGRATIVKEFDVFGAFTYNRTAWHCTRLKTNEEMREEAEFKPQALAI